MCTGPSVSRCQVQHHSHCSHKRNEKGRSQVSVSPCVFSTMQGFFRCCKASLINFQHLANTLPCILNTTHLSLHGYSLDLNYTVLPVTWNTLDLINAALSCIITTFPPFSALSSLKIRLAATKALLNCLELTTSNFQTEVRV